MDGVFSQWNAHKPIKRLLWRVSFTLRCAT